MPEKHFEKKLEARGIHDLEFQKKTTDLIRTSGDMKFASLHHHTTFSFLDGFGTPKQHVKRAAEVGMPSMALTEHGNMTSHPKFERAANAAGIKPVFGVEMYCGAVDEEHRQQVKNHLTLLAEDQRGYRNLLQLVERSYAEGFYYEPTVSGEMLAEHKKGLVVLSGCNGSLLATSIVGGKGIDPKAASAKRGLQVAKRFQRTFGDAYYLEVQAFPELENTCKINQVLERISRKLGIPLVATGDVHYSLPEENEMQQILHNVRGGSRQTLEQQAQAWGYDIELCIPTGHRLIYKRLLATGLSKQAASEAVSNAIEISQRCSVQLPKAEKLRYPLPTGVDPLSVWRQWIHDGWFFRKCNELPPKVRRQYKERLRHEMKIIEDKDFIDYFLVISDAVRWAKDHGIPVGPARGSAAGSLVCWLLRITEVNPMLFPNLVFERFIDVTREDEPDIDLDFDDELRDQLRDYLVAKYGEGKVANLATFVYYKSKNSLDDIARVHRVPQWEVDRIKGLLIERSSGDLRATATIEDTVEMFDEVRDVFDRYPELNKAMTLEGNIKGMGVHAAGIVVSNKPIHTVIPVIKRKVKDKIIDVAAVDKYDAEVMGLLKADFLGLKTMGFFRIALEYLGLTMQHLYDLPLDDPVTLQGFKENDVVGIFQYDGQATKDIASTILPEDFREVYHVNALCRPGPLHNGATATYINVKKGTQEPRKLHPIYDEITADTHYEIVYQEQIMRIVMEIGGFDWTNVAYIRRLISRRMGEQEFNRSRGQFMKGAKAKGLDKKTADIIWRGCITAGAYAFNAAHAVSYGMNAYWTMWIKRHHPKEFYAAALQKYEDKQTKLLQDAVKHGIKVLPPHPTRSGLTWKPTKNGVRAGFTQIPGIGHKMASAMLGTREGWKVGNKRPMPWEEFIATKGIGPKKIMMLREFVEQDDPFGVTRLERTLAQVAKEVRRGKLGDLPKPTHKAEDIPYEAGKDVPVVWVGTVKLRNLRDLFEFHLSKRGEELDPDTVKRPDLREWVVMLCEDETEVTHVTFNRFNYPRFKQMVWDIKPGKDVILVKGKKRGFLSKRDILVDQMWVIEP